MTDTQPAASPASAPRRWLWLVSLLILTGLAAGLVLAWPQIQAGLEPPAPLPTAALPPVAAVPPPPAPPPAAMAETAKGVPAEATAQLDERITRLERSSADAAAVLRLMERLDRLDGAVHDLQSRRKADAALILSIGLLKEAVDRGAPFDTELRALKVLAPEDGDIAKLVTALKPRGAAGIPSRQVLAGRFVALESAILRAETLPAPDRVTDWQRQALERVLTLFTLRREDGEIDGSSAAAVVARAHGALDRNDWAEAIRQVQGLTGEAAKAAQNWLNDAVARQDADRLIADVAADAVAAAAGKL